MASLMKAAAPGSIYAIFVHTDFLVYRDDKRAAACPRSTAIPRQWNHAPVRVEAVSCGSKETGPRWTQVYKRGDRVRVLDGRFRDHEGLVVRFDAKRHRVSLSVTVEGREVSVETKDWQLEKLSQS
jgi:hypothetical protein